jgi:hypothetical protein
MSTLGKSKKGAKTSHPTNKINVANEKRRSQSAKYNLPRH